MPRWPLACHCPALGSLIFSATSSCHSLFVNQEEKRTRVSRCASSSCIKTSVHVNSQLTASGPALEIATSRVKNSNLMLLHEVGPFVHYPTSVLRNVGTSISKLNATRGKGLARVRKHFDSKLMMMHGMIAIKMVTEMMITGSAH